MYSKDLEPQFKKFLEAIYQTNGILEMMLIGKRFAFSGDFTILQTAISRCKDQQGWVNGYNLRNPFRQRRNLNFPTYFAHRFGHTCRGMNREFTMRRIERLNANTQE
jgi:hypothetical protein